MSEILRVNDVVLLLLDAIPKPCFSSSAAGESPKNKDARRDFFNLAATCTDLFYPCMEATWSGIFDLKVLLAMLLHADGGSTGDLQGAMRRVGFSSSRYVLLSPAPLGLS